jgi:hypothetical protein
MNRVARLIVLLALLVLGFALRYGHIARADNPPAGREVVLKAADISPKIFPERVFFRGQVAPAQLRNTGGVHFADDLYVMAGLVDSSGYSTGIREKYQGYLLSEVTLQIGDQTLKPGAYGFGFIAGGKFVVMDLGANDVLQGSSQKDAELKHPVPLQVVASSLAGTYRLYSGRDYVEFHRTK